MEEMMNEIGQMVKELKSNIPEVGKEDLWELKRLYKKLEEGDFHEAELNSLYQLLCLLCNKEEGSFGRFGDVPPKEGLPPDRIIRELINRQVPDLLDKIIVRNETRPGNAPERTVRI